MSGQQPDPRVPANLAVRVWGMDAEGKPFFQKAQASNISSTGALLSGIGQALTTGDVIGVQCGDKKARYKVIRVLDAGALQKMQVGIQLLEGQECPWKAELTRPETLPAAPQQNRRRRTRHKVLFPLELRDERIDRPMRVSATDISANGCYVETIMPLAAQTSLKIAFWMESEKIITPAVVRSCDPGFGMGIEFTGLDAQTQERFQQLLEKMEAGQSTPQKEAPAEQGNAGKSRAAGTDS